MVSLQQRCVYQLGLELARHLLLIIAGYTKLSKRSLFKGSRMQSIGHWMETYVNISYIYSRCINKCRYEIVRSKPKNPQNPPTSLHSLYPSSPFQSYLSPTDKNVPTFHPSVTSSPGPLAAPNCGWGFIGGRWWLGWGLLGAYILSMMLIWWIYPIMTWIWSIMAWFHSALFFNDSLLQNKVCLRGYLPLPSQAH